MSRTPEPVISVCICTYRRPEGLARLLASLHAIHLPVGKLVELVVVDNDVQASGQEAFEAGHRTLGWPARYVVEAQPGVGHARTRCLQEAAGEWVAFIDDDEWAEPQWLAELWRLRQERDADGVFGPVLASFDQPPPDWIVASRIYERPRYPSGMSVRWQMSASGNVLFRRRLFFDVGGFDPAFAQSGSEDSDFFWRCLDRGAVFIWSDEAVAHEGVPAQRMTRNYLNRRAYVAGQNYVRLHGRRQGAPAYLRFALRGLVLVLIYAPLALGARLLRSPAAIRFEGKVKGGLGKMTAGCAPPSRQYGAGPVGLSDQQG